MTDKSENPEKPNIKKLFGAIFGLIIWFDVWFIIYGIIILFRYWYNGKFVGTLIESVTFDRFNGLGSSVNTLREVYIKGNSNDTCTIERNLYIGEINNIMLHNKVGMKKMVYTFFKNSTTCFYDAEENVQLGWFYIKFGLFPIIVIIIITSIVHFVENYRFFGDKWYTKIDFSEDLESLNSAEV